MIKSNFKRLLPLWLLLLTALILFVGFSFYETSVPGNDWLKKGPFKATLLADEGLTPEDLLEMAQINPAYTTTSDTEPDSIHNMLLFGDSMTILVANRMAYYGKQNNFNVSSVTWYSSSTKVWGECDTLAYFINKIKPDFIIVTLGSNELFIRNISDRAQYVKKILNDIGDIPFVWIGPPNWKKDTGINDMVEANVSSSRFFRTDGMQLARSSDNVHPTQKAADQWADSIMRWIGKSQYPIVANYPDTVTKKPKHSITLLSSPKNQ